MSQFAQNLKILRKEKNLTQEQMAKFLNITQQAYARYEKGDTEPSYETLYILSDFFRTSLDHLMRKQLRANNSISFENSGTISGIVNIHQAP